MNNDIKYQRKFAVLEATEPVAVDRYKTERVVKGYVPSICYLVESKTTYLPDGNQTQSHLVVFPFSDYAGFKLGLVDGYQELPTPKEPEYDEANNVTNGHTVEHVFDSLTEAIFYAKMKNEDLFSSVIKHLDYTDPEWKTTFVIQEQLFDKEMEICRQFAQAIQVRTDRRRADYSLKVTRKK